MTRPAGVDATAEVGSDHAARRRALALAIGVTLLWSSSWVMLRWAIDDHGMTPLLGAGLRYLLACLVLVGVMAITPADRRGMRGLGRRDLGILVVLGLLFYAVTQGAQVVAIASQPAATTSLVLSFTPLLVALASQALLGERPAGTQVAGAAVIGLGANVASSILGRGVNRALRLTARAVTTVSMAVGALTLVLVGWLTEGPPRLDAVGWGLVAWMAVFNTALAFTWWNESLRHLSATESSAVNNLMLLEIAALAWLLLGEAPGVVQWVGMALVTLGVLAARGPATVRSGARRSGARPSAAQRLVVDEAGGAEPDRE